MALSLRSQESQHKFCVVVLCRGILEFQIGRRHGVRWIYCARIRSSGPHATTCARTADPFKELEGLREAYADDYVKSMSTERCPAWSFSSL